MTATDVVVVAVREDGLIQAFGPFDSYRLAAACLDEVRYKFGWRVEIVRLRPRMSA